GGIRRGAGRRVRLQRAAHVLGAGVEILAVFVGGAGLTSLFRLVGIGFSRRAPSLRKHAFGDPAGDVGPAIAVVLALFAIGLTDGECTAARAGPVALLAVIGIDDAITAVRTGGPAFHARRRSGIAGIACFTSRARDDSVPAARDQAIVVAAVTVDPVAVVAFLAGRDVDDAVPATRSGTIAIAPRRRTPIIAFLVAVDVPVSATGARTIGIARARRATVVAFLAAVDLPVTTVRAFDAGGAGRATVGGRARFQRVARLEEDPTRRRIPDPVPAEGTWASTAGATVAWRTGSGIERVTGLPQLDDRVPAQRGQVRRFARSDAREDGTSSEEVRRASVASARCPDEHDGRRRVASGRDGMTELVPGSRMGCGPRSDGLLGFEDIHAARSEKVASGVRPTPGLTRSSHENLVGAQRGHGRTEEVAGSLAGALKDADAAVSPGVVGPIEMDLPGPWLAFETVRRIRVLGIVGRRSYEDVAYLPTHGSTEAIPLRPLAVRGAQHLQDVPGCIEDV